MKCLRRCSSVLLAVLAVACGGRVARTASIPYAAPQVVSSGCALTLQLAQLDARSRCTIDARVAQGAGALTYACSGGAAELRFGETVFAGTFDGRNFHLEVQTTFPFSDGCQWGTKQEVTGALGDSVFSYSYREAPEPGYSGCAAACFATGTLAAAR